MIEKNNRDKNINVPASFFGFLLESIDDILILKCAIRAIFIINSKNKNEAFVIPLEVEHDLVVRRALAENIDSQNLSYAVLALDKCVEVGILRQVEMPVSDKASKMDSRKMIYFLSSEFSKITQERLDRILVIAMAKQVELESLNDAIGNELPIRFHEQTTQSLFEIYEANIGLIYPLAAEKLQEMENEYPHNWIVEAFSLAVSYNKRNLAYIEAILRRWNDEGRGNRIDRGDSAPVTIGEIARRQQRRK